MTRQERANYIASRLETLYPNVPVPLDHSSHYTLLIAVLLSAQCTDERVNKVTPVLFKKADTPSKMIKLSKEDIYLIIRPCGLAPKKSSAIYELSKTLIEKHNSQVPENFEDLEKLPGVGHKTASVVMSQGFGHPAFPVDTHIHRLAQRWGLSKGKNVQQTEKDLKKVFPRDKWNRLHLQIIFYGREYCSARGCNGTVCEICKTLYPNRKKPFVTNKA
ncbi:MAG: endonuclease III [Pseudomonadota bacterium]|nr:endonuclease III [Porticoccaceae bacterium]MEC7157686.1 endonuclease III [Pseudomonadota bacterium]MAN53938.1 endonuclease III [Porticoccaceae bacterium]MDP7404778.1 endonuclease III [Porticoccaceae bacterium]MEC7390268.1 endonuclease III [Pseudomonadota bacterium]|tara:strand:- start:148 stop:801 length:654 start_codon:yes stop_codon:yes gene_type:complete